MQKMHKYMFVPTLFTAFTNICFKEPDAFSKLIIVETYNYSPRYISDF